MDKDKNEIFLFALHKSTSKYLTKILTFIPYTEKYERIWILIMIVVAITIHGGCDAHVVTCLGIYVHTTTVGVGNPVKS